MISFILLLEDIQHSLLNPLGPQRSLQGITQLLYFAYLLKWQLYHCGMDPGSLCCLCFSQQVSLEAPINAVGHIQSLCKSEKNEFNRTEQNLNSDLAYAL